MDKTECSGQAQNEFIFKRNRINLINATLVASKTLLNSNLSSFLTVVKHKTNAAFLWTTC